MDDYRIGVIGGSGLYGMEELVVRERRRIETPFGEPSDRYVLGEIGGRKVAFLARHGSGHGLLPSEINFRANIYGFKLLGAEQLISISAVGSMKSEYEPTHIVVADQFYDRTRHRADTFFGKGLAAHVSMADPVCPALWEHLGDAAEAAGATVHRGGTYLCMEGPQFSTRGESQIYRQWGVDVIGMTNIPEAKLAREAEICYATLAMVTDYDCWHETEEDVNVEAVLEVLKHNAVMGQEIVKRVVQGIAEDDGAEDGGGDRGCSCREALKAAIITDPNRIPAATLRRLAPIVGKYLTIPGAGSGEDRR
ncbi:MAG: S-methyl-5'-thioadenosine phosphorylase [bacterium]|nr:S-methyl-5'-thioadenosine phosphorylase [bacterium]